MTSRNPPRRHAALVPAAEGPWSLADHAYFTLREQIVTLRLRPGQAIHEERLIRDLGIGRTPLRDALRRLVLDHLVTVTPSRGTFVRDVSLADLTRLGEVRAELEPFVAELAAQRASDEDRAALLALEAELADIDASTERETLLALYYRSHQLVYQAAQNILLTEMLDRYLLLAIRAWYQVLSRIPEGLARTVSAHAQVLASVRRGEAEQAAEAALSHVRECHALIREVI